MRREHHKNGVILGRRVSDKGAALIIDYGHVESDVGETLQSVNEHAFSDPLSAPGLADITAHVDFQSFGRAAESMGAQVQGPVTQGHFLNELGIEDAFELTGLYQGIDRIRRSVWDPAPEASRIFLFRRPILDEWAERGDVALGELISHILVHEIGHHLGLSDDDIDALEAQAD